MMNLRLFYTCLLTALGSLAIAGSATAQPDRPAPDRDPAAIAERCISDIANTTRRCIAGMDKVSEATVAGIERALENDNPLVALKLARQGVSKINNSAKRSCAISKTRAERCAALLERLDSPDLAGDVLDAAERGCAAIRDARDAAAATIRAALPERAPGEDDDQAEE